MIAWMTPLIEKWRTKGKLTLVATVDHVELTSTHLVIGFKLEWGNRTDDAIAIKDIQVQVYLNGRDKEPLRFYPLERFARVIGQRAIQKTPIGEFTLPVNEVHAEQIRFISQEILDIPAGKYTVEVQIEDADDNRHTSRTLMELESKSKYRRSEEWVGGN
jgi:hypothetical protein